MGKDNRFNAREGCRALAVGAVWAFNSCSSGVPVSGHWARVRVFEGHFYARFVLMSCISHFRTWKTGSMCRDFEVSAIYTNDRLDDADSNDLLINTPRTVDTWFTKFQEMSAYGSILCLCRYLPGAQFGHRRFVGTSLLNKGSCGPPQPNKTKA